MIKRYTPLLVGGLVLGLILGLMLVVFGSLTLAHEPVSQGDDDVRVSTPVGHVERQEPIRLPARQVISRAVRIEPVHLQITEKVTIEAQMPLAGSLLPKARVVERYHAVHPIAHTASADTVVNAVFRRGPRLWVPREPYKASERLPKGQINETKRPTGRAGTCTVSSTDDSGPNTLQECLQNAVAGDDILFDPSVFPPENPQTITLSSELPPITVDGLTIDASNAGVILDGSGLTGNTVGLRIDGMEGVTIQGLQILSFKWGIVLWQGATNCTIGGDRAAGAGPMGQGNLISGNSHVGIELQGAGTSINSIIGNFIGTDLSGNAANGNDVGVFLSSGASHNVIGGAHTPDVCDSSCNLISGNHEEGIVLQLVGTDSNQILGNFIGTNVSGNTAVPNNHGIAIALTSDTQIGGSGPGEGNLISGNTNIGVWISWAETTGTQVLGNMIGTDATGAASLPNYNGVYVSSSTDNQIGGVAPGSGNLISGNEFFGIVLFGSEAPGNTVAGNKIGTDMSGTLALPNYGGVAIAEASSNTIGGTDSGSRNLISGNVYVGVQIEATSTLNSLVGNFIGTDLNGSAALPNEGDGVFIGFGASNNTVGGSADGAGNLISGNGESGIKIQDEESIGNRVLGNNIGTNLAGSSLLPNSEDGVTVMLARETIIGGAHTPWVCEGSCNLISGNGHEGVHIQGKSAGILRQTQSALAHHGVTGSTANRQNNQVLGNFIGTDLSGSLAVPNVVGVALSQQAVGNVVGGSISGEGNLISGNQDGIELAGSGTTENQVLGNRIGTTADGNATLGNGRLGVFILSGAFSNTVGGREASEGNLISGNNNYFGVQIQAHIEPGTNDNQVVGNLIGTNWDGTAAIPNLGGVALVGDVEASDNRIDANLISGNTHNGMEILGAEAISNVLTVNLIGVAADGQSPLPNGESGIVLSEAHDNTVGSGNTIAANLLAGVALLGPNTVSITITQNSIYGNGLDGILFYEAPDNTVGPGNTITQNLGAGISIDRAESNTITQNSIYENVGGQIVINPPEIASAPKLTRWDGATVSGSACGECQVEVFANTTAQPEGRTYLGTVTAAGNGDFTLTIGSGCLYLSATATNARGTTSPFAPGLRCGDIFLSYLPLIFKNLTPSNTPTPAPVGPTPTSTSTPTLTPTPTPITPTLTPTSTPSGWVIILEETFEGDFPGMWTVLDGQDGYGEYHWGKRDCRTYAGSYSGWAVGSGTDGATLACGSNYPDYAYSWMVYGPFSLADATAGDLTFKLWLNSEYGYDYVARVASVDGTNFYGYWTTGNSEGWIDRTLDLTDVPTLGNLMGQSQVWIALVFVSDFSINYPEGAYVDNIVLRKYVPSFSGTGPGTPVMQPTTRTGTLIDVPIHKVLNR